jgi:hypothetical protein
MNEYQIEIEKLKKENEELRVKLEKYVGSDRHKKYYQENKEEIKQRNKEYREKTNYTICPEKKKQYARTAYLNKKAKEENQKKNIII